MALVPLVYQGLDEFFFGFLFFLLAGGFGIEQTWEAWTLFWIILEKKGEPGFGYPVSFFSLF